jgi:pimeloyl-ACP methyl ester carboxylesterase
MLHSSVAALVGACTECDWTIVGHSRGAVHALDLVAAMPGRFSSLVIAGSTHPREKDFSRVPIRVMKVIATNDGVAPMAMSDSNRRLLPPSVRWEIIEGGNHSQFGYYGFQIFDGRATISRQEQHSHVVDSILSFSRGSS